MPRKLLKIALAIAILLIGAFVYTCWKNWDPKIGQAATANESPVSGLPKNAKNIRYHLAGSLGPATAYEFDISEAEFQAWKSSLSTPELEQFGPGEIYCVDPVRGPDGRHEIVQGIRYLWRHLDEVVEVGYDRDLGRAYYYRCSR